MEFKYLSTVVLPQAPSFNYDELKTELETKCSEYATLVYTDDQIKEAKADRATLNKLKKALNDERIAQEKGWNAPFIEFKSKVNELIGIIDSSVQNIDKQVKGYEKKEFETKKNSLKESFEKMEGRPDWLTFDRVFDDSHAKKSASIKTILEHYAARIEIVNRCMKTLEELPEYSLEAILVYKETMELEKAMAEVTRRKNIDAMRKAQEEEGQKEAERRKAEEEARKAQLPPTPQSEPRTPVEPAQAQPKIYHVRFETDLTMEQATQLRTFCDSIGITLTQIKE